MNDVGRLSLTSPSYAIDSGEVSVNSGEASKQEFGLKQVAVSLAIARCKISRFKFLIFVHGEARDSVSRYNSLAFILSRRILCFITEIIIKN